MSARVLVLAYSAELGGAERSTVEACARLDRDRFEPILAVPREGPLAEAARAAGVDVILDGTPHDRPLDPGRWVAWVAGLAAQVRRRDVRLVHAGTLWRVTRAAAVAVATGRPAIGHVRDQHAATFASARFQLAARRLRRLVAISGAVRDDLVGAGLDAARVELLANGIDVERFEHATGRERVRAEWGVPPDAPLVAVVGNVEERKGQLRFLESARQVAKQRGDVHFAIVGSDLHGRDDAYARWVAAEAEREELRGRVHLAGRRDDVPEVMAALDLLVVPSALEPFGRVAVEAMAAGRPVLAHAVGGLREIVVDGETGWLIDRADPGSLAEATRAALGDAERARALGEAGRSRARALYSLERHVAGLERIYGEVLEGR